MVRRLQLAALALAVILVAGILVFYCVYIRGMWYPKSCVVSLGDLDGDGDLDALVGNGHTDDTGSPNAVWFNDGRGGLRDSGQRLGERHEHSAAVTLGDLDGDGDLDAIFGNESANTVWQNDGTGRFGLHGEYVMMPGTRAYMVSKAVALEDLDGDGDLDAFVGNCCRTEWVRSNGSEVVQRGYGDAQNTVWVNEGRGRLTDSGQLLGNESTLGVALGDLDGDGDLDAFVANMRPFRDVMVGSPANKVWLNDGTGRFTDSGQALGQAYSAAVALGDLDGDGDLDAFVGNADPRMNGEANRVWLNDGTGCFADSGQLLGKAQTRVVVLTDLDGDGDLDAFVDNAAASCIWLNDGQGRLRDSGQRLSHTRDHVVNVGDLDGDGDADVLVMHYDRGYQVWRNDGAARFHRESRRWSALPCWVVGGVPVAFAAGLFIWWTSRRRVREKSHR